MKILHRFILAAFLPPLAATFFVVMFVLILQFLWLYIDELVGKGLDVLVVAELIFYAAINLVTMALPLSVLLSSIMLMGNLGDHRELIALKSAGISVTRIVMPVMVVSALLAAGSFFMANNALPYANLKFASLLFSVKQQRPELQIRAGVFYDGIEGYVVKVDSKDEQTGLLRGIMIYDHSNPDGTHSLTIADSGYLRITDNRRYLVFTLYGGNVYEEIREKSGISKYPMRINSFGEQESIFELVGYGFERSDESLFKNRAAVLDMKQLGSITDSLSKVRDQEAQERLRDFFRSSFFVRNEELHLPDSALSLRYVCPLTQDSMLAAMNAEQKSIAAESALRRAKEAKNDIVSRAETISADSRQINVHNIQWHLKITYALACLIFFFVGAPLGVIIRKGGVGVSFVISLIVFLIYYVISTICQKIAKDGTLNVSLAMWVSTAVTAVIGAFLTYKTVKDRSFAMPQRVCLIMQSVKRRLLRKREQTGIADNIE